MGKILLVDDDDAISESLSNFLRERYGLFVDCVSSAEEALAFCSEETYAAFIIDLRMPTITGIDLIETLLLQGYSGELLVFTGSPQSSYLTRLAELGIDDDRIYHKPLADMSVLAERLKSIVEGEL